MDSYAIDEIYVVALEATIGKAPCWGTGFSHVGLGVGSDGSLEKCCYVVFCIELEARVVGRRAGDFR